MARKSRKEPIQANGNSKDIIEQISEKNIDFQKEVRKDRLPTAAYIRLSVENNGHEGEESLRTQISLVESYIHENEELELLETYVDNGYSGTKFDRPEFVRMLDDVKRGKIRCIVVKDLSRFGRDYLETGYYLETIFPLLNVRFIAVTDYFDSNRESDRSSLSVPVKNMVNAMYAKDYSRKQEVFREMCIKTGKVMSYNVPYGYRLCKDTGRMEINREVEMYVRMIFSWALADVPMKNIAERLCFLNVPIRSEYEGWNRKGSWEQSMVRSMVYNPAYAGFHVMGKSKVSIYRGIPSTRTDRSEWIYFPDYHEAYITMEDYQKLNEKCCQSKEKREKHLEPRKEIREMLTDCFPQMVYCGTCGRCMSFYRGTHKKGIESESFQFYRCKYNKDHKNCSHKRIQQNFLKIIVMDQIRYMVQSVCDRDGILKSIENGEIKSKALEQIQRKVMRLQEKENRLEEKLLQAYMDHTEKLLDEQDYLFIKTKLSKDKESVVSEKRETENRLKEMKLAVKAFHQHTEKVKCFLEGVEFDETLVRELISKIWVHEDGERIEVEFQCLDVFENMYVNEIIEGA